METSENVIVPDVFLVIGNGFDRQCDLKSSYYDFLIDILKKMKLLIVVIMIY